ncbi:hypothetical protein J6590_106932, partial [Homalodisca vitripennis]
SAPPEGEVVACNRQCDRVDQCVGASRVTFDRGSERATIKPFIGEWVWSSTDLLWRSERTATLTVVGDWTDIRELDIN